jgi:hypothetical protein
MISVGDLNFFYSKQTRLRACQSAQQMAARPTVCKFLFLGKNLSHHSQNWLRFEGLQLAPTIRATILQTYLAKEQSKNK